MTLENNIFIFNGLILHTASFIECQKVIGVALTKLHHWLTKSTLLFIQSEVINYFTFLLVH